MKRRWETSRGAVGGADTVVAAPAGVGPEADPAGEPVPEAPNGWLLDEQGREIPITEAMIERAIRALEAEGAGLGGAPPGNEGLQ